MELAGGFYPYREQDTQCKVVRPREGPCTGRRRMTRIQPRISGLWVPVIHHSCQCNEEVAMRERVIAKVPQPTAEALKSLDREGRVLAKQCPHPPKMSQEAFVNHYVGRKKERYRLAVESLKNKPLQLPAEALVKAFVKPEKMDPGAKVNPAPRMIQARNARFNVEIGCFLKPIEHALYMLRDRFDLPLIGKGLDPHARGKYLREKWDKFSNPVCISIDASRWDMHVSVGMLDVEHKFYLRLIDDPWFRELLSHQMRNRVVTMNGIYYKTKGRRMSGDMNTALGNCALMILCVRVVMKKIGIRKYTMFDDGDDCLLIFEKKDLELCLRDMKKAFLELGHEVKIEGIAKEFSNITWCQQKPVNIAGDWIMVSDWRKNLSCALVGLRYFHDDGQAKYMAYSIGQCLLALNQGVPIIQKYGEVLCRFADKINVDILNSDWMYRVKPIIRLSGKHLGEFKPVEILGSSRSSFAASYGVDEVEQLRIENELEHMELGQLVDIGTEMFPGWIQEIDPLVDPVIGM